MRASSFAWLLAILPIACSQERSLDLSHATDDDPEAESRRRRMNVTVIETINGQPQELELDVRTLARTYILDDCYRTFREEAATWTPAGEPFGSVASPRTGCSASATVTGAGTAGGPPTFDMPTGTDCHVRMCRTQAAICTANRLLELATTVAPATFATNASTSVEVPPQDTESAVAYYEEAFHYAAYATTQAGENLRSAAGGRSPNEGTCAATGTNSLASTMDGTAYGSLFVMSLADATLLAEEAAQGASNRHQAVADADFSRVPDQKKASRLAWTDTSMSRARGAHVLTGGSFDDGLTEEFDGVCPLTQLSEEGKKARDILRFSGMAPEALSKVEEYDFASLFSTEDHGDQAMRTRFAERFSDSDYLDVEPEDFLSTQGLTEADFDEARNYLAEEAIAFGRGYKCAEPARCTFNRRANHVAPASVVRCG